MKLKQSNCRDGYLTTERVIKGLEEMRGYAIEKMILDEWEVYNFTEEVLNEVGKMEEKRKRNTELLNKINFRLSPMDWTVEYFPDEDFTDVIINYGMPK